MTLPVLHTDGDLAVIDPDTGEALAVPDASDRALMHAAEQVANLDADLWAAKRAIAAEMRRRHGVGVTQAGGYHFTVTESSSWPLRATSDALHRLAEQGAIGEADVLRCLPAKPKPDTRQLNALLGRLLSDPDAARVLADARTVSPPSLRDVRPDAVDAEPEDADEPVTLEERVRRAA